MLSQDRWILPDGIEEVLPADAAHLEALRRKVLDLFFSWGYCFVMPPLIEFIEPLLTGAGSDLDLQTFKLIDQQSGRLLGVRADLTPQVARIDARTQGGDVPSRLCYLGTVLHTHADHLSRSRDPLQVGAELYGHAGLASDLEIIRLMLEMLDVSGLPEPHLDLGHVGIYRGLADQAGLDERQETELFEILQRKAGPELQEFLKDNKVGAGEAEMLAALEELHGGFDVIGDARRRLGNACPQVLAALEEIAAIGEALRSELPALNIHFDLAELRGYHYKTGAVFAAFVDGYGKEVARGGRYDEIGKAFGRARPATGFSADLKTLARLGVRCGSAEDAGAIFAPASPDPDLREAVIHLRRQGRVVVQELAGQTATAEALGCRYALARMGGAWQIRPLDG